MLEYKVIPLMYSANDKFHNTIRVGVVTKELINKEIFKKAVEIGMKRYPYFSVKLKEENEKYIMLFNDADFVVSENGKAVCLGSEEANEHLVAFSFNEKTFYIDISHFITDGTGVIPLVKTIAYYYFLYKYNTIDVCADRINLFGDEISWDEEAYPYPTQPLQVEKLFPKKDNVEDVYVIDKKEFDAFGCYAYYVKVKQTDLLKQSKNNDGSPVSYLSVMLNKTICNLNEDITKNIICTVPHQYRQILNRPLSHDCLVKVVPVVYSSKTRNYSIEKLNTITRGQIIYAIDEGLDAEAVNGMIMLDAYMEKMPLTMKKNAMISMISKSRSKETYDISYVGKTDWSGLEKYFESVYIFAGEKEKDSINLEVLSVGEYFDITFMQNGKGDKYVTEFIRQLRNNNIEVILTGEGRYQLSDFSLPNSNIKR